MLPSTNVILPVFVCVAVPPDAVDGAADAVPPPVPVPPVRAAAAESAGPTGTTAGVGKLRKRRARVGRRRGLSIVLFHLYAAEKTAHDQHQRAEHEGGPVVPRLRSGRCQFGGEVVGERVGAQVDGLARVVAAGESVGELDLVDGMGTAR